MHEYERKRVLRWAAGAGAIFLLLLGIGTVLFAFVEGEGGEEAFYRAFGSLTRVKLVGDPTTSEGRALTAALTIVGTLFFLALVGTVVQWLLVRNALTETMRVRRTRKQVDNLSGHVLVCGYGHVGRAVVKALVAGGQPVVVIDVGQDNVDAARQEGALAILGDADEDEILQQAGVTRATALVATVGSDAQNLYIAFAARRCNDHLRLVARAADPESKLNLEAAGLFDEISTPYESAGRELAGFALAGSTRLTV